MLSARPRLHLIWINCGVDTSVGAPEIQRPLRPMTSPSQFELLLQAAASQPEPQRLLFVFAAAELPADASAAQRARFEAGQGGALTPLACVDKAVGDLSSFEALVAESRRA